MPLQKLQFRPGVSRESTSLANEGSFYACDKVRFRSGQPEKIGGWTRYGEGSFLGICRSLVEWESLSNYLLLGLGTHLKYYILSNQTFYDITPIRVTIDPLPDDTTGVSPYYPLYSTLAGTISASATSIGVTSGTSFALAFPNVVRIGTEDIYVQSVSGDTLVGCVRGYNGTTAASHSISAPVTSSWIAVKCNGHGAAMFESQGDYVTLSGATAFGPYAVEDLNQNFAIKAISTDYFLVDVGVQSTSATAGGGTAVKAEIEISTGAGIASAGAGWGASVWTSLVPAAGVSVLSADTDTPETSLNGAISASETTIAVVDASSLAASGYVLIDTEIIQYASKSGNNLQSCTRASLSTTAAAHASGARVGQLSTTLTVTSTASFGATSATGSLIVESEVMTYTVTDGTTLTVVRSTINATSHAAGATVQQVAAPTLDSRPWNTPATTGTNIPLRLWSADTFGQDLVCNIRNAGVYYWMASTGLTPAGAVDERLVNIGALSGTDDGWRPKVASRVIVTDERHIVVFGTNDPPAAVQDFLLVRWCDQENPIVWEPSPTNTAGFQRLTYGSRIVTAEKTRQETLIWTDAALYSMRYLGPPYVFGFNTLSAEVNIASPNAVVTANNITYWMGTDKFYAYSGRVDTLPCSLRQYVFADINAQQIEQVYAGGNEQYNEVWWFYPSAESDQNDRYVVYNYLEKIWYYGQLSRSAWYDSHIRTYPLATEAGALLYHEYGADDATDPTNPAPISNYIESADFDLGEGDQFSFVKRIIPDVDFIGSQTATPSANMTVSVRNFPGQSAFTAADTESISGSRVSIQVYDYTDQEWIRLRGRQVAFKIGSDALGVKWQMGVPRLDLRPDGRR